MVTKQGSGTRITVSKKVKVSADCGSGNMMPRAGERAVGGGTNVCKSEGTIGIKGQGTKHGMKGC